MNPTKLAIGGAVFLLVISLAGLAVTTKEQVNRIEQGGNQGKVTQKKEDPSEQSAGRLLTWLLIFALALGIIAALYKVWQEVRKWQSAPPRIKQPWEFD